MSEQAVADSGDMQKQSAPKKKKRKVNYLLWVTVIVPTLCSAVYFGLIAADQFTSRSSFVVRSSKNQASLSDLGAILQSAGLSRAQDDTYTVSEYMASRTALQKLSKTLPVRSFYEGKGDIVSGFNGFGLDWLNSDEAFYQYYKGKVGINFEAVSGITSLNVTSFEPQQSQRINAALLKQGEALINQLNERARNDTVRYAEEAVKVAEERVKTATDKLTTFRLKNGIFDLKAQSEVHMGLVSKLQDELIMIQTQLAQVRAITPENPQILGLQTREKTLKAEIAQQMNAITGSGAGSLTQQAAEFQRVQLENELAQKQLAAAMASRESAKAEADRQQLYLEVVDQPSVPDMPQKPNRLYNIFATFVIGLIVYGVLSLLAASVREHKN